MEAVSHGGETVFSAHAEVVLKPPNPPLCPPCILRARGGSSARAVYHAAEELYSPRTRR